MARYCKVWQGKAYQGRQAINNYNMNKKVKYQIPGIMKGVKAGDAAKELLRIRKKHGELTPELVVEESRKEDAVLHKCFQWDDARAAELYRIEQAGRIIRNIVVPYETSGGEQREIRLIGFAKTSASPQRVYIPMEEIYKDDVAKQDLLLQAKTDMELFLAKYVTLDELSKVKQEMLRVILTIK